jgi:hypothetical protein
MKLPAKARCTWCDQLAPTELVRDAAHVKHYFHARCLAAQRAWLRGWAPPKVLGSAWDHPGGPVRMRGINRRRYG